MSAYRIYRVGPGGRLLLGESFDAPDDGAAVERARAFAEGEALELWQGGRLVGKLSKLGRFTPGG